jgi:RNA polymerase II C-terminal domain phosphatase-like 3/4
MSLAEAPSPSPSSSSGSDDFAALLDSELELASGADSAFPGDPSSAFPAATDDEDEDEDEDEDPEVEAVEQNGYAPLAWSSLFLIHCWTSQWVWWLRPRD